MRITVFGAAGSVGGRAVAEALHRGHEVTAVVRNPKRFSEVPAGAIARVGDASSVEDVVALSAGQDVVISATRPAPGRERDLVTTTKALMDGLRQTRVRLLLVGGAASLKVPGANRIVVDDPVLVPPALQAIAQACNEQLEACRVESTVDWTYLSPPAVLEPGERTGRYRTGSDTLVVDPDGRSHLSVEDLAVALLDEVESPQHRRARFTVAS
ncbi:MAG: NAD(P)H-binding protein [Myxococcota bacterium]